MRENENTLREYDSKLKQLISENESLRVYIYIIIMMMIIRMRMTIWEHN